MTELDVPFEKLSLISQHSTEIKGEVNILNFSGKNLNLNSENDAKNIVESIQNGVNVTTLCLNGNTIGINAAKAIGKALESQQTLKKAFWNDIFTQRTVTEIPQALRYLSAGVTLANAQLTVLDLSDNAFGPRGIIGVVDLLGSPSCYTLEELYFNNNGLGIDGAKILSTALLNCLTKSQNNDNKPFRLKIFTCGRNRIENDGCITISEVLRDIKTLERVEFPQNGIYSSGIIHLVKNLSSSNIKCLNLNDNTLSLDGSEAMADSLSSFKDMEILNLGDCLLRSDGAKLIANALQKNCLKLKELYLGYNEINFEVGLEIIKAVSNKEHFEKLNLNGNQFGEKGCILIQELLKKYGEGHLLESLSEDEGSDDEDYENDISEDSALANKLEKFMTTPTLENLMMLYNVDVENFLLLDDITASECFELFIKVCSIVDPNDEKIMIIICNFVDAVLSKAFESCPDSDTWKVNSEFFIRLGLVECEDEPCEITNHRGLFLLLNHASKQNYFHNSTKELLKFLLPRTFTTDTSNELTNLLECLKQNL